MTLFPSPFAPGLRANLSVALGAALSAALLLAACATVPTAAPEPASPQPRLKMTPALETDEEAEEGPGTDRETTASSAPNGADKAMRSIDFALGSATLDDEGQTKLRYWAQRLKEDPKARLSLTGHTDDLGSRAYNLAISDQRVAVVVKFLRSLGIPLSQLHKFSLGGEKNRAQCRTPACERNRRRVEISFGRPSATVNPAPVAKPANGTPTTPALKR